ncbi:KGG domain-containing protein [Ramlibacter aurantiacus]
MDNTSATNTNDNKSVSETATAAEQLMAAPARAKRGFAVLSPEKKREIASMGGKAAHEHGRAHRFTSEEARAAGKKRHQMRVAAAATKSEHSS